MRNTLVASALACTFALGSAGCGDPGPEPARDVPVERFSPALGGGAATRDVDSVAEAVAFLEDALQDAYLAGAITPKEGSRLLELAELARVANEGDDFVRAFGYIEQAHARIESQRVTGEPQLDEAAFRLHQAFDLLGAMIATHPPGSS